MEPNEMLSIEFHHLRVTVLAPASIFPTKVLNLARENVNSE